jgi:hypothetical protein
MIALEGVSCVRIFPARMKPWTAWVHFHRNYSINHHELNHSQPAGTSGVWSHNIRQLKHTIREVQQIIWAVSNFFTEFAKNVSVLDFTSPCGESPAVFPVIIILRLLRNLPASTQRNVLLLRPDDISGMVECKIQFLRGELHFDIWVAFVTVSIVNSPKDVSDWPIVSLNYMYDIK